MEVITEFAIIVFIGMEYLDTLKFSSSLQCLLEPDLNRGGRGKDEDEDTYKEKKPLKSLFFCFLFFVCTSECRSRKDGGLHRK